VARRADSTREQAAAGELLQRWARYRDTSLDIRQAIVNGQRSAAVGLAIGAGNSDFNGFNTAVESVLSDNRIQFLDGIGSGRERLDLMRAGTIVVPALAALLALWAFQRRIREYTR
jgi:hypothetical protein